jgi:hypothetical protein
VEQEESLMPSAIQQFRGNNHLDEVKWTAARRWRGTVMERTKNTDLHAGFTSY